MLKIVRCTLILLILHVHLKITFCQNYFVSNLYNNIVFSNPSVASFSNYSLLQLNYRNQWPVADMYTTYGISFFHNAKSLSSNFGLILNQDRQFNSVFTSSSIGANYSYHLKTGYRSKLLFGINGNYVFENINYNLLSFEPDIPPPMPDNESHKSVIINSGLSFVFGEQHLIGFSAVNILGQASYTIFSPEYSLCYIGNIKKQRWGKFPLILEPIGVFTYKNDYIDMSYGCNFGFSPFKIGLLFSQSNLKINTTTFLLGILHKNYEFIYTYDLNLSGALSVNPKMAAHEVTFLSKLQYKVKRKKHGAIKCPKL
jgi:type IX secretion system PorP/SprF family membrane protein